MKLDEGHPKNKVALSHLRNHMHPPLISEPVVGSDDYSYAYREAGSHPDIIEYLWEKVNGMLSIDCRAIVYGSPVLVNPHKGLLIALAYGTQYAIRIPDSKYMEALQAGCRTKNKWSNGDITDIEKEMGEGWVFGCWADEESKWLEILLEE